MEKKDKDIITLFLFFLVLSFPLIYLSCAVTYSQYNVSLNRHATTAENFILNGDYDRAITSYKKAHLEYEDEKNEQGVLLCLERMGWLLREMGDYGEALKMLRKAYPIGIRLNGDAAEIDADLGDVYMFSGDTKKADEHYRRALNTLKDFVFKTEYSQPPSRKELSVMVRKSRAIIHARVNLGTMRYFAGNYEAALQELKKADELIQRIMTVADHPLYGMFFSLDTNLLEGIGYCQTMLGAVYGEKGRFEKGRKHFKTGKAAFKAGNKQYGLMVNQALRFKIEFLKAGLKADRSTLEKCEIFLNKADRFGAEEILWRMCFEIGKAMVREKEYEEAKKFLARAIDSLELTRSRLREDTLKRMFASSVQDVYSEMITLCYEMRLFEEGFDYLERAKARAFLDILAGRSVKAKKTVDPKLVKKAQELQDNLDILIRRLRTKRGPGRKEILKEYKRLQRERENILEAIKGQSLEFASTTTVTIVPVRKIAARLGKGTALISYFLGSKGTLVWVVNQGKISALSVDVGSEELGGLIADYRNAIALRQERSVHDIGKRLSGLLIKPVEERLKGAGKIFIVPSKKLHYLPFSSLPLSEKRFVVQDYTISILPNASSLFFLDKEVTDDRESLLAIGNPKREEGGRDLRFAELEVRSISKEFHRTKILTGKDARESAIKETDLIDTGVIHIAAHGKYDERHPLKSALLLTGDEKNDGNFETFEIFSLSMNPRLVVLSACQSGIGKVGGGDEVESLNRAFLYAGAGGVVASLWSVSDRSTYKLMEYFYGGINKRPAADALREAQIRLMKEYPAPFNWAPFYLTGGLGD